MGPVDKDPNIFFGLWSLLTVHRGISTIPLIVEAYKSRWIPTCLAHGTDYPRRIEVMIDGGLVAGLEGAVPTSRLANDSLNALVPTLRHLSVVSGEPKTPKESC